MKQQPTKVNHNAERVIAEYLRNHPDFFNRQPELLNSLRIPHPCRPAISIVERQIMQLRDQNGVLKKKLRELVKVARDNDCLSKRMQHLNLALLESRQLDDMLSSVQSVLRDEFSADFTALRLAPLNAVPSRQLADKDQLSAAALALFGPIFDSGRPLCGRLTSLQATHLFDDAAEQIASAALVPLVGFDWKGIMAIGSRDDARFHPGMGTLFLNRIGELVAHALQLHLQRLDTVAG